MYSRFVILSLFLAGQLFHGCSKDAVPCTQRVSQAELDAVPQTQLQKDITAINDYLIANSIVAETEAGLRYVITNPGAATIFPCLESQLSVTYTGKLMSNGNVFETTVDPVGFTLNQLILGWKVGLLKISAGATITLYIPSGYAYGTVVQRTQTGVIKIPANSNLIFEIQVHNIANP